MATTIFVEDWLCYNTPLGEGAFGEVKLLTHRKTEEKVACKIIDRLKYKNASSYINREVTIHKMLDHENIIKFFGRRQESLIEYIFLEYASGGELFQLIEPDIGMPSHSAQRYMKQLLCGVNYLHTRGIAHRDIKPENLLISEGDILKISDFGMATLFRFKGKERLLDRKCGTKPYLAPEVLQRPYKAQPSDLWSCGIVFVAMLTGELPWSDTLDTNEEYDKWKNNMYMSVSPWSKLSNISLSLARQMLTINPEKRLTLAQIEAHPWMKCNFTNEPYPDVVDSTVKKTDKQFNSVVDLDMRSYVEAPRVTLSQPVTSYRHSSISQLIEELKATRRGQTCFSQPIYNENLMIQFTESPVTKDNFHNLSKRMTRFYVATSYEKTLEVLCSMLDSLRYTWNTDTFGAVTISTVDCMKNQLTFKANIFEMDGKILLDFRLSKGCGLEFKKKFLKLKTCLSDIVNKTVP